LTNHGNRVHDSIHITIPATTPNHPHQGKVCNGDDVVLICLEDLKIMKVRGIVKQRIKMAYPPKTLHENGAWWTY
jgi:hypothetical protein